jgi:endonuclease IV
MKLLIIYCETFGYKTSMKTLEEVADQTGEKTVHNAVVGFINMEAEDEDNAGKAETKLIKNLKWAANKNESKTIVLHSFAHLSESKAEPAKVAELLNNAEERLRSSGFDVSQTPFGYFLDLEIKAPGNPLTRLFKSF